MLPSGPAKFVNLRDPILQNWVVSYTASSILDRIVVPVVPASGVTLNVYNYDDATGNIGSRTNVSEQGLITRLTLPTSGSPYFLDFGISCQRGITVRLSAPAEIVLVYYT